MKLHLNIDLSDPFIMGIWEANQALNPEWEGRATAKLREIVKEKER